LNSCSASSTLAVSAARSASVARAQAMRTTVEASHSRASVKIVDRHAAELVEVAEAVADQAGIALADEGAAARTRLQRDQPGRSRLRNASRTAPRLTPKSRQLALRRQLIARAQLARGDAPLDLLGDLVRQAAMLDGDEGLAHGVPPAVRPASAVAADPLAIGILARAADVAREIGVERRLVAAGRDVGLEMILVLA